MWSSAPSLGYAGCVQGPLGVGATPNQVHTHDCNFLLLMAAQQGQCLSLVLQSCWVKLVWSSAPSEFGQCEPAQWLAAAHIHGVSFRRFICFRHAFDHMHEWVCWIVLKRLNVVRHQTCSQWHQWRLLSSLWWSSRHVAERDLLALEGMRFDVSCCK